MPMKDIRALFDPYHEMDIRQFCDAMSGFIRNARPETNLKLLRRKNGLSQKTLSEISSVPLRTIQQYGQRQKNINKAQAEYFMMLSGALNCSTEQLIERIYTPDRISFPAHALQPFSKNWAFAQKMAILCLPKTLW